MKASYAIPRSAYWRAYHLRGRCPNDGAPARPGHLCRACGHARTAAVLRGRNAVRDRRIYEKRLTGVRYQSLVDEYEVSAARIGQIIAAQHGYRKQGAAA